MNRAAAIAVAAVSAALTLIAGRLAERRYERALTARTALTAAAYLRFVVPPADSDYNVARLLVEARALTTLPGWDWSVEVYHRTAPLVDAAAPPLDAADVAGLPRWSNRAVFVPLVNHDESAVVGVVALRPSGRHALGRLLFRWGLPAALVALFFAAAFASGQRPFRAYTLAALALGLAAYTDVYRTARHATNEWLGDTGLLVQEAATRSPLPRTRVPTTDLAGLARAAGYGGDLSAGRLGDRRPWRSRGLARMAVRLTAERWLELRTWPAEAGSGGWLVLLAALALLGPFGIAGLSWMQRARRERRLREAVAAWAFLTPALAHVAVFSLAPLAMVFYLATHRGPVVSFDHFRAVLGDRLFWTSLRNTVLYALSVPVSTALALLLALALHRPRTGLATRFAQRAFLLPYLSSGVAVALLWRWIYQSLPGDWLGSPRTALLAVIVVSVWVQVGYQVAVFLAGLRGIPAVCLDAARVDGANAWQRFWRVTFPLLRPLTVFTLVTGVCGAFQVFTAVYVMTGGGPLHATDVVSLGLYATAWNAVQFGPASAMSVLVVVVLLALIWLQFRILARQVTYA